MMLAFNKSAALEMEDRLTRYLIALSGVTPIAQTLSNNQTSREVIAEVAEMNAIEIPWVMTFDSLARAIIESKGEIEEKTFIANEEKEVTRIVLELLADPHYRQEFKEVMLANFKDDWDQLIQLESGLSSADRDLLRRSLPRETYKGERVKSAGEKRIADFLFRSTIPYIYEKNVRVDGRKFKPDFTIEAGGRNLYIEYAGMLGDETYAKAFREKKEAFTKANFDFLVLVPSQIADESFEVKALAFLKKNGFEVSNSPLKPEDYWDEYLEAKFRRRFTEAVKMFINRIRQARVGAVEFYANRIDQLAMQDKVAYRFTLLAWKVYEKYASNMTSENTEDFKDVLQRAVTSVSNGSTKAIRRGVTIDLASLRYISVDEYQDFSELYDDLVRGMHNLTSGSAIFAVGDHWQSINSFMGASTELFDSFISRWVNARQREITFNYRSCEEVVEVGNNLMRNTHGSPSKVGSDSVGRVWLMDYETLVQGQSELSSKLGYEELGIIRILQHIFAGDPDSSVAILSRKNSIPWWYQGKNNNSFDNDLQDYLNLILRSIDISKHSKISIHTVHKFKGLEADRVIILDALDKSIPLIHNDWRFARIFGDSPSSILSEERRVFYVALTRARKELFVLTRSSRPSGFIADLKLSTNNWELFPPGSAGVRIVCNGNTFAIKPVLLKAGFQWYSPNKEWVLDITEFATNKSEGELLSAIRISKHYWVQSVKRVDDVSVYLELEGIRKVIDWTTQ
jgi:DNA helicase-4